MTLEVDTAVEIIVTVCECRTQTQSKLSSEVENSGVLNATVQTPT